MSRISSNPVGGFKKVKALLLGSTSTSGAGGDEGGRGPDSKDSLASKGVLRVITTSAVSEVGHVTLGTTSAASVVVVASASGAVSTSLSTSSASASTSTGLSTSARSSSSSTSGGPLQTSTPHTTGVSVADETGSVNATFPTNDDKDSSSSSSAGKGKESCGGSSGGVAGSKVKGSDAMILANHVVNNTNSNSANKMTVTTSATGLTPGTGVRNRGGRPSCVCSLERKKSSVDIPICPSVGNT